MSSVYGGGGVLKMMMVDDLGGGIQKRPFCDDVLCEQPLLFVRKDCRIIINVIVFANAE